MSILINGMEMPTSCMLCSFCVPEADEANGEMCMVTGKLMPPCNHERLDGCPLVPVPPHGRLIDADALKDVQQADADLFKGSSDYGGKCRYDEAINAVANIVNAPTIIPASGGKEDE